MTTAENIADCGLRYFAHRGVDFEILKLEADGDLLKIIVIAKKGDEIIPINNPIIVSNPPVAVENNGEFDSAPRSVLVYLITNLIANK